MYLGRESEEFLIILCVCAAHESPPKDTQESINTNLVPKSIAVLALIEIPLVISVSEIIIHLTASLLTGICISIWEIRANIII